VHGFAPQIHPDLGVVIAILGTEPDSKRLSEYSQYVDKLVDAIRAAMPVGLEEHVIKVDYRSIGYTCFDQLTSRRNLQQATFVLSEYVDSNHLLVKIATLTDWDDFKAAVDALPVA
jgi:hypothetical protein